MSLQKLQEIARAATQEQDALNDVCQNCYCTMAIDALDEHTDLCHNCAHDWYVTFHPRLIEKLLAEVMAAREIRPYVECVTISRATKLYNFDKAREALDLELNPEDSK